MAASLVLVLGTQEITLGRLADGICDLRVVDALAHIRLAAMRIGGTVVVRGASDELRDLLALVGLADLAR